MKKAIKTLSIVSLAFAILSVILFAVLFALRNVVGTIYMTTVTTLLPVIPAGSLIGVLSAALICLFVTLAASGKTGIWAEILLIILIIVPIPIVVNLAGLLQTTLLGTRRGVDMMVSLSVMNNVTSFAEHFAGAARMLALVVCGMSIAVKKLTPRAPAYLPMPQYPQQMPQQSPWQQPPMN